jgi:hypothetical protein
MTKDCNMYDVPTARMLPGLILQRAGWIGLLLVLLTSSTSARTISVPGTSPTIKGAMIQARAGDIILVSCGIYREANIQVKPGVSLWSGTLQPDCVTVDARGQGRCLIFTATDSTSSVVGFTFRGGRAAGDATDGWGGAVLCENSAPRLTRCIFRDNTAVFGGALAATGQRGPRLELCRFEGNEARRQGGAVHWSAASGSLLACALQDNSALLYGGGISGQGGKLRIDACLLRGNSAGNAGGALGFSRTDVTVTGTLLIGNLGGLSGGALASSNASPRLRNCTLHANDADGDGTVLSLVQSHPTLEACLVTGSGRLLVDATDSRPVVTRSSVWADGGPAWPGVLAPQQNSRGNLARDPLYCAPKTGDFHLLSGSPCLARDGVSQIGALGQGCGAQFPPDVLD